ncbi:hypothetical protein KM043_013255 [Ampulex compressa]|nr:hypothetical protein KM043_013255 [Ampulex compressa]
MTVDGERIYKHFTASKIRESRHFFELGKKPTSIQRLDCIAVPDTEEEAAGAKDREQMKFSGLHIAVVTFLPEIYFPTLPSLLGYLSRVTRMAVAAKGEQGWGYGANEKEGKKHGAAPV